MATSDSETVDGCTAELVAPEVSVDQLLDQLDSLTQTDRLVTPDAVSESFSCAHKERRLQLFARVFEDAQEGIVILNAGGAISECNRRFREIVGRSTAELDGALLENTLLSPSFCFEESLAILRRTGTWTGEVDIVREEEQRKYWASFRTAVTGSTLNIVAYFSDVTKIAETQDELHHQARYDNLTNLPNRRYFCERLAELVECSRATQQRFSVLFIDLDDFKHVNDSFGHEAGDELLVAATRRIREHLPPDSLLARFGGDEFALILPQLDEDPDFDLPQLASECLLETLAQPFMIESNKVFIGCSVGATTFPDDADDMRNLMRNADMAMYAAKSSGKNCWVAFDRKMNEAVETRRQVLADLREGIRQEQFEVFYQPQISVRERRVVGCEALIRWRRSDGKVVLPGEFLSIAEQTGLISPLTDFMLLTACKQIREWKSMGWDDHMIAVNVSPRQMRDPLFIDRVEKIIKLTRTDPTLLELEITENAIMDDAEQAMRQMERLRELGVAIAIDDFGTGYSSLSYLKKFAATTLKVDGTFVSDLPHDRNSAAVVRSIVSLGNGLGLKVLAECVETQEQVDFLADIGCDVIQGYFFGRPLPAEDYQIWRESTDMHPACS
ncbi:MAG: EAL domain-containing protein [Pirellulaceae bacterium]